MWRIIQARSGGAQQMSPEFVIQKSGTRVMLCCSWQKINRFISLASLEDRGYEIHIEIYYAVTAMEFVFLSQIIVV